MLECLPDLQNLGKVLIGGNAVEIQQCDLVLVADSYATPQGAIVRCKGVSD